MESQRLKKITHKKSFREWNRKVYRPGFTEETIVK